MTPPDTRLHARPRARLRARLRSRLDNAPGATVLRRWPGNLLKPIRLGAFWLVASLLPVLLLACGGGGGSGVAGVGSGGTGAFSLGTITGFGSVIVNGKRFDDSNAAVSDDDGPRSRADLKLGMVVKVQGSMAVTASTSTSLSTSVSTSTLAGTATATATASSVMFDSALLGPVTRIDVASRTLVVLGQQVALPAVAVLGASLPLGLASIQPGQVVEVHGFLNAATGVLQASLIERLGSASPPAYFKLSGQIANLQGSAKTLQIGPINPISISYANLPASSLPSPLANGVVVKIRLLPQTPLPGGDWTATRLTLVGGDAPHANTDGDRAEVEGLISAVSSATQFSVGGVRVDARNARAPDGSASIVAGARAEVKGVFAGGTLAATDVEIKQALVKDIELHGTVSGLDVVAQTLVVRGSVVNYAAAQLDGGSASQLANGVRLEVRGKVAPDSPQVNASRIRFDN